MIGKQIGRYLLTEEIGRGGMGIVYKATQVTLNRTVAVKMLPQDLASSHEYLSRFTREAETLATLQHPNIVHIYDVEEAEGCHFIIMEYVGGPPLTRRLQSQGRLAPVEVQSVSIALTGALDAAHRKGIVHRDIKPDNILFSEDGTPKLTDFGIARMRDSNVKTQTGVMLGTPYYMSPEQVSGAPVRGASDVYSLGIVMYEMLSGRVPFSADTPVAVALKHLQEQATPLAEFVPSLPNDLCAVVDRAIAKDLSVRYESAKGLRRALRGVRSGPAAVAEIEPPPECPRCQTGLRADFRSCPSCGLAMGEIRARAARAPTGGSGESEGVPAVARGAADAARGAAEAARGAADVARNAADAGLDRLVAAGGAVADSADAALGAVARSAGAVWSAVGRKRGALHPEAPPAVVAADRPGQAAESRELHGGMGSLRDSYLVHRAAASLRKLHEALPLPDLNPVAWIGLVLVVGALLVAALLGLGRNAPGATALVLTPPGGTPSGPGDVLASGLEMDPLVTVTPTDEAPEDDAPQDQDGEGDGEGDGSTDPDGTGDGEESEQGEGEEDPADETRSDEEPDTPAEPEETPGDDEGEAERKGPGAKEEDPEGPEAVAAREAAARASIHEIVARQQRATNTNDLDLYVSDLHPDARSHDDSVDRGGARRGLRNLHRGSREIESRISNVRISFDGDARATVRYFARIRGIPRGEDEKQTLAEGDFRWELVLEDGRWLIMKF